MSRVNPVMWLLPILATACTLAPAPAGQPPNHPCDQGGFADLIQGVAPSVVTVVQPQGLGSGVVYKPDVVITNQHVVAGNTDVRISYADGTESGARVLAADAASDLAVLRTERTGLTPLPLAKDQPRQGCQVLAIGSPLGLQNSVTEGIVSGLHRTIQTGSQGQAPPDLIQTDAPISPGNSGGALIDLRGQVIGINESYIPPQAGAVSLGFAIPAATAADTAEQLLASGSVRHAYLGVSIGDLTPSIRDRLGAKTLDGAVVLAVEPNSPAALAGVELGDVIVRLDDKVVHNVDDVFNALRAKKPGDPVTLAIVRGDNRLELRVTLGAQP
jgi:serine protease Do